MMGIGNKRSVKMKEYHKINTLFKRDMTKPNKPLIMNQFSCDEFYYLKNNMWTFTEKIDGTNIRVIWEHATKDITFKGKTNNAQIPANLFKELSIIFNPQFDKLASLFPETDVCLYGEGYGVKINSGGNYIPDGNDFILFDIRIGEWWLKREDVEGIAKSLDLDVVPIIGEGTLVDLIGLVKTGFKSQIAQNTDFIAEGVVARPKVELKARNGERIITKLKYCDFKED
jgi:hypothetical protein